MCFSTFWKIFKGGLNIIQCSSVVCELYLWRFFKGGFFLPLKILQRWFFYLWRFFKGGLCSTFEYLSMLTYNFIPQGALVVWLCIRMPLAVAYYISLVSSYVRFGFLLHMLAVVCLQVFVNPWFYTLVNLALFRLTYIILEFVNSML